MADRTPESILAVMLSPGAAAAILKKIAAEIASLQPGAN